MEIDPRDHEAKDLYKLLIGCVVPRPIAWVTTLAAQGGVNLAPFSFFNAVCSKPPTLSISFSYKPAGSEDGDHQKDTLANLRREGEFVVNVVNEPNEVAMNASAAEFPRSKSELEALQLAPAPSGRVKTPRLAAAPIALECVPVQEIELGDGPGGATLVLAEVLRFVIQDRLIDERLRIDLAALRPVGRLAGTGYCYVRDIFSLERPRYEEPTHDSGF